MQSAWHVVDLVTNTQCTQAIVVPSAIHFVVGNVVEPAIFGHSMELHPVRTCLQCVTAVQGKQMIHHCVPCVASNRLLYF